MKLLIFATLAEASATIRKKGCQKLNDHLFHFSHGIIVISGLGSYAAQMACAQYGSQVDEIINLGFAASLKDEPIGKILTCQLIGKFTPLLENLDEKSQSFMNQALPQISIGTQGKRLISSDFPVHSQMIRDKLNDWDLLDMEGYGIAFASRALNKKCRLIKVISDFAKTGGREYIEKHKEDLAEKLSEVDLGV